MQFPLNPKSSCRPIALPQSLRRASLRMLPFTLINGALVQVAQAQVTGAPAAAPSALSSLVSTLSVFAFLALLVGLFRPKTFAFLFKEKATRGRVCAVFGAAWLFLVILDGPLKPKRVATAPTQSTSQSASGNNGSAVRLAENRAKAAEARAARAEKAAAVTSTKEKESAAVKRRESIRKQVNKDLGIPDSLPESQTAQSDATKEESLPDNVEVVDIPNVGKRQLGKVDGVIYMVGRMEKAQSLGGEYLNRQADGMFYVLRMRAVNTEKKTHNVNTQLMKLVDGQDREFDSSSGAAAVLEVEEKKSTGSSQLQPGVTKDFNLVFDAPADAKGLRLKIPAGGFGFGKSATLRVPGAGE